MTSVAEPSDRTVAWAGLLRCCEPPVPAAVYEWIGAVGPEAAWRDITTRTAPRSVGVAVAARLGDIPADELAAAARRDVARAAQCGARILAPGDDGWPAESFAALEWVGPYSGCDRAAPPLALYLRGSPWAHMGVDAIAVVGSRAATPYGARAATELGAAAVAAGHPVISGAAFGIDAAAHRGALRGEILDAGLAVPATIAVLACGIDRSYPVAHRPLLDAIAARGTVITEYPPGTTPARHRFLVRNRLIAAAAAVTVVVEAGRRSGSLNTANTAGSLGRIVAAVPGPVTSAMSVGCHELIADHRAELVTGWPDLAGMVGPLRPEPSRHRAGDTAWDGLDLVTARVYDALPGRGAATVDEIVVESALPVAEVLAALTRLQLADLADRGAAGWVRRAGSDEPGRGDPGRGPVARR